MTLFSSTDIFFKGYSFKISLVISKDRMFHRQLDNIRISILYIWDINSSTLSFVFQSDSNWIGSVTQKIYDLTALLPTLRVKFRVHTRWIVSKSGSERGHTPHIWGRINSDHVQFREICIAWKGSHSLQKRDGVNFGFRAKHLTPNSMHSGTKRGAVVYMWKKLFVLGVLGHCTSLTIKYRISILKKE